MTERARLVLEDARAAAKKLPSSYSGPHDKSTMRRGVVEIMALLRAVGHVLRGGRYQDKQGPVQSHRGEMGTTEATHIH